MPVITLTEYDKNAFSIEKFKDDKYNVLYNGHNFIIDTKIAFEDSQLWIEKKPYKIKIDLDITSNEHIDFESFINVLINEINMYCRRNKIMNVELLNPLIESNSKENTKIMYLVLTNISKFKNIENNQNLSIDDIKNKCFSIYPSLFSPSINISNGKIYINFTIKTGFIKINNEIKDEDINYDDAINIFNKLNIK